MKHIFQTLLLSLFISCKPSSEKQNDGAPQNLSLIVDTLVLKSRVFQNNRNIRVLLPPDYFNSESKRYPVLYLNDGVMVFDAYHIEQVVHDLIGAEQIEPIIIVGIDNGASAFESNHTARDRANEYLPWPDEFETGEDKLIDPKGRRYPDFLINEVMPLINNQFRTKTDPKNTGLGGSSYGALISLYTTMQKTESFGQLLLESPSLYVDGQHILSDVENIKAWPDKVYIGIGTAEGETINIQKMAVDDTDRLVGIIKQNDKHVMIKYVKEAEATHDFDFFAKRFPIALKFLFGRE